MEEIKVNASFDLDKYKISVSIEIRVGGLGADGGRDVHFELLQANVAGNTLNAQEARKLFDKAPAFQQAVLAIVHQQAEQLGEEDELVPMN